MSTGFDWMLVIYFLVTAVVLGIIGYFLVLLFRALRKYTRTRK